MLRGWVAGIRLLRREQSCEDLSVVRVYSIMAPYKCFESHRSNMER